MTYESDSQAQFSEEELAAFDVFSQTDSATPTIQWKEDEEELVTDEPSFSREEVEAFSVENRDYAADQIAEDVDSLTIDDSLGVAGALAAHVNRGLLGIVDLPFAAGNAAIELLNYAADKEVIPKMTLPVTDGLSFATDPYQAGLSKEKVDKIRPYGIMLEFAAGSVLPLGLMDEAARVRQTPGMIPKQPVTYVQVNGGAGVADDVAAGIGRNRFPVGTITPRETLSQAAKNPTFLKREVAMAGASGAGAGVGSAISDGNPWVELGFGVATPASISLLAHSADNIGAVGRGVYDRLSKKSQAETVVSIILDHASDKDAALKSLRSYYQNPTGADKTLGQITRDKGILGFEARVSQRSKNAFNVKLLDVDDRITSHINKTLDDIGGVGGAEAATNAHLSNRIAVGKSRVASKLSEARRAANSRLERAGTDLESVDASIALQDDINKIIEFEEGVHANLWARVPETKVNVSGLFDSVNALFKQAFKTDTSRKAALKGLTQELKTVKALSKRGDVDVQELIDLRSILLDKLRGMKTPTSSSTRFPKKLAADIQGELFRRIDAVEGGSAYKLASAQTKLIYETLKNTSFKTGDDVAEVLGRNVFASGERGAKTADELIDIGRTGAREGGVGAATTERVEDLTRAKFMETVVKDGVIDLGTAKRFMRQKSAFLSKYPAVRAELEEAIAAQKVSERMSRFAARSQDKLEKSRAATFIDFEDPVRAVNDLVSGKTLQPSKAARALVNSVNKDKTGNALVGLKRMTIDALVDRISNQKPTGGEFKPTYRKEYQRLEPVLNEVFKDSPDSLKAIKSAMGDLDALMARRGAPMPHDRISEQLLIISLGKIAGARIGAKVGVTPLISASIGGKLAEKILATLPEDKINHLIEQMILEPDEFMKIAEGIKSVSTVEESIRVMNAWLLNAGVKATTQKEREAEPVFRLSDVEDAGGASP